MMRLWQGAPACILMAVYSQTLPDPKYSASRLVPEAKDTWKCPNFRAQDNMEQTHLPSNRFARLVSFIVLYTSVVSKASFALVATY